MPSFREFKCSPYQLLHILIVIPRLKEFAAWKDDKLRVTIPDGLTERVQALALAILAHIFRRHRCWDNEGEFAPLFVRFPRCSTHMAAVSVLRSPKILVALMEYLPWPKVIVGVYQRYHYLNEFVRTVAGKVEKRFGISPSRLRLTYNGTSGNRSARSRAIHDFLKIREGAINDFWHTPGRNWYCPLCRMGLPTGTPFEGPASQIHVLRCEHVLHKACFDAGTLDLMGQCPKCESYLSIEDDEFYGPPTMDAPDDESDGPQAMEVPEVEIIDLTGDGDDSDADTIITGSPQGIPEVSDLTDD